MKLAIALLIIHIVTIIYVYGQSDLESSRLKVSIDEEKASFELLSVLEIERIIPLETKAESAFGMPAEVLFANNHFIIRDWKSNIFIFNEAGEFVFSPSKGLGPDEYRGVRDFLFDPNEQCMEILELPNIVKYSLSGDFVSRYGIGQSPSTRITNFEKLDDKQYVFFDSKRTLGSHFIFFPGVGNQLPITSDVKLKDPEFSHVLSESGMGVTNCLIPLRDTIYEIVGVSFMPKYIISFNTSGINKRFLSRMDGYDSVYEKIRKNKKSGYLNSLFQTEKSISFNCLIKGEDSRVFLDKFNHKTLIVNEDYKNKILFGPIGESKEGYIFILLPTRLKGALDKYEERNPSKNTELEKIKSVAKDISLNDNIVLVIAEIKQL